MGDTSGRGRPRGGPDGAQGVSRLKGQTCTKFCIFSSVPLHSRAGVSEQKDPTHPSAGQPGLRHLGIGGRSFHSQFRWIKNPTSGCPTRGWSSEGLTARAAERGTPMMESPARLGRTLRTQESLVAKYFISFYFIFIFIFTRGRARRQANPASSIRAVFFHRNP
jgi:hypothetical protein